LKAGLPHSTIKMPLKLRIKIRQFSRYPFCIAGIVQCIRDISVVAVAKSFMKLSLHRAKKMFRGANFILKWKSDKKITQPVIEAIHSGARGTHSYTFDTSGKVIRGVYE